MNKESYYPGKGCQCCANSESECGCPDVDWTDPRIYELETQNAKLRGLLEACKSGMHPNMRELVEMKLNELNNL